MKKVRVALGGLMAVVLVPLTAPAAVAFAEPVPVAMPAPAPAQGAGTAELAATQPTTAPPGPRIDPTDNERANAQKTKNKVIVGVIAGVLAVIVVWGRGRRAKRKKPA